MGAATRTFRSFIGDESGQAVTEYVLILTLAIGGAIGIAKALIGVFDKFTLALGAQLEKDLKSGRANADPGAIWSN